MGTFKGLVCGLKTTLNDAQTPWSRPRRTDKVLIPAAVRAWITFEATSGEPLLG